ncbi:hypothetical protein [Streptomyces sp. BF23-19]|uniref:hypothetical protein n=1 Tax=Streptomyces TaxID=1883 RepID=UPI0034E463E6|nr:hypothetical protein OG253_15760 [Streptomyces virginiae]
MTAYEVLLIGSGSGVGKSTLGWEVSELLRGRGTAHRCMEGDFLDQIHPAPEGDPDRAAIAERNLASIWANYSALGQDRRVYTDTVSIPDLPLIHRAMGGDGPIRTTCVLLTACEETVRERLARREIGSQLAVHVTRSRRAAALLGRDAPPGTVRVATAGRSAPWIARRVVEAAAW